MATTMYTNYKIERSQGIAKDGRTFGYVTINDSGGVFFTWRYSSKAWHARQVRQVLDTLEDDEANPPTGRWSWQQVQRALKAHIRKHGLHPLT